MGILYSRVSTVKRLRRIFAEGGVDEENQSQAAPDDTTDTQEDSATDTANDTSDTTETNDNQDQGNDDAGNQDDAGGGDDIDMNFDMDGGDGGGDDGDDGGSSDSGSSSSGGSDNPEDQEVDEIKQQEENIFSDLSPEQLDIKHKELKNQFLAMYDMTSDIIDRISDVNISEDITLIMEYVSSNLSKIRSMISDYINTVYMTKSYTENLINYNRFMATLNGINNILSEIGESNEDNNTKKA